MRKFSKKNKKSSLVELMISSKTSADPCEFFLEIGGHGKPNFVIQKEFFYTKLNGNQDDEEIEKTDTIKEKLNLETGNDVTLVYNLKDVTILIVVLEVLIENCFSKMKTVHYILYLDLVTLATLDRILQK